MKTIVTLTMNPAIDKSSSVEHVIAERKLYCKTPRFEPGGGGINVTRAIKKLGGNSVALYPSGGPTGEMGGGNAAVQGEGGESRRRLPGRGPGGATMNRLGKTMRVVETRRRQSAGVSGEAKGAEREAGRIMVFSLGVRDRRVPTGRAAPHLDLGVSHHRANVVSEPLGYQTRPRLGSPTHWRSLHVGA